MTGGRPRAARPCHYAPGGISFVAASASAGGLQLFASVMHLLATGRRLGAPASPKT